MSIRNSVVVGGDPRHNCDLAQRLSLLAQGLPAPACPVPGCEPDELEREQADRQRAAAFAERDRVQGVMDEIRARDAMKAEADAQREAAANQAARIADLEARDPFAGELARRVGATFTQPDVPGLNSVELENSLRSSLGLAPLANVTPEAQLFEALEQF